MKKFVTLALALIMALSLAAPALAFTGVALDVPTESGITLDIRLVDVSTGYVGINFSAPPTNRGYASGQLVCAIVDMQVPKGKAVADTYDTLTFSGKNLTLWQDENFRPASYGTANVATSLGGGVGMLQYISNNTADAIRSAIDKTLVDINVGTDNAVQSIEGFKAFSYAANMAIDNSIILELIISKAADGAPLTNRKTAADPVRTPIFPAPATDQNFQFAIFGRVTGDDASMTATLKNDGAVLINAFDDSEITGVPVLANETAFNLVPIKNNKYAVGYFNPSIPQAGATGQGPGTSDTANPYFVPSTGAADADTIKVAAGDIIYVVTASGTSATAKPIFAIITDKNFKTKEMYVYNTDATAAYRVQVVTDPAFEGAHKARFWDDIYVQFTDPTGKIIPASAATAAVLDTLGNVVADTFGLDIRLIGTYMNEGWWAGASEDSVTVKVEPWYAEVTVPPEIEIEIPKTGDALSVMGFVLIALAGLAVVAVRKVRA